MAEHDLPKNPEEVESEKLIDGIIRARNRIVMEMWCPKGEPMIPASQLEKIKPVTVWKAEWGSEIQIRRDGEWYDEGGGGLGYTEEDISSFVLPWYAVLKNPACIEMWKRHGQEEEELWAQYKAISPIEQEETAKQRSRHEQELDECIKANKLTLLRDLMNDHQTVLANLINTPTQS